MAASKKTQKTLTSFFNRENKQPMPTINEPSTSTSVSTPYEAIAISTQDEDNEDVITGGNCDKPTYSWPSIWTAEMWERKKNVFPWLDCRHGKLGCKICKEVGQLGAYKEERISISKEWHSYLVSYNGSSKTAQLTSLRKKIFEHKNSAGHLKAERITSQAKKEAIENVVDEMTKTHLKTTKTVFRTAYFIAKKTGLALTTLNYWKCKS